MLPGTKKMYKRYFGLNNVFRRLEYDLKHGVINNELVLFLRMIKIEASYLDLRKINGALNRLNDIEIHFSQSGDQVKRKPKI